MRGERRRGGDRGAACCALEGAGWADTHAVLQQLLGVVDGTDDSCPPAASTATTVTAGSLAEVSGWERCVF